MRRFDFASHVAVLDDLVGAGLLVLPHPTDDLAWAGEGSMSLQEAGWNDAIARLAEEGFEPLAAVDGAPEVVGLTVDGRTVLALYGVESISTFPDLDALSEAHQALATAVNLRL